MRSFMAGAQAPQDTNGQGMQTVYSPSYPKNAPMHDKPKDKCPCIPQETSIECVNLAQAYVPFQKFCGTWPPLRSLLAGTVFAELFSPYKKREYVNLEPEVTCGARPVEGGGY